MLLSLLREPPALLLLCLSGRMRPKRSLPGVISPFQARPSLTPRTNIALENGFEHHIGSSTVVHIRKYRSASRPRRSNFLILMLYGSMSKPTYLIHRSVVKRQLNTSVLIVIAVCNIQSKNFDRIVNIVTDTYGGGFTNNFDSSARKS